MRGKKKCKILKDIRQKIADENDIPFVTQECTFQGECKGTCPKCESELRYLEKQLESRQRLGKSVTIAALAASLMTSLTACPTSAETAQPTTIEDMQTETSYLGEVEHTTEETPQLDSNAYIDLDELDLDNAMGIICIDESQYSKYFELPSDGEE